MGNRVRAPKREPDCAGSGNWTLKTQRRRLEGADGYEGLCPTCHGWFALGADERTLKRHKPVRLDARGSTVTP